MLREENEYQKLFFKRREGRCGRKGLKMTIDVNRGSEYKRNGPGNTSDVRKLLINRIQYDNNDDINL